MERGSVIESSSNERLSTAGWGREEKVLLNDKSVSHVGLDLSVIETKLFPLYQEGQKCPNTP